MDNNRFSYARRTISMLIKENVVYAPIKPVVIPVIIMLSILDWMTGWNKRYVKIKAPDIFTMKVAQGKSA